jgi:hypothetical protein
MVSGLDNPVLMKYITSSIPSRCKTCKKVLLKYL